MHGNTLPRKQDKTNERQRTNNDALIVAILRLHTVQRVQREEAPRPFAHVVGVLEAPSAVPIQEARVVVYEHIAQHTAVAHS